jgi:hypothetical protein
MIIMQFAEEGDLHNYLKENFTNITWKDKLTIILEISRGYYLFTVFFCLMYLYILTNFIF